MNMRYIINGYISQYPYGLTWKDNMDEMQRIVANGIVYQCDELRNYLNTKTELSFGERALLAELTKEWL